MSERFDPGGRRLPIKLDATWGPDGVGYWLDGERAGIAFIEKARALGVKLICVHKGIPLFNLKL